jgi:signal transduction histidine kinase
MTHPLPSPGRLGCRLAVRAAALDGLACALAVAGSWSLLGAGEPSLTERALLASGWFAIVSGAAAVSAWVVVRRVGPLYRALSRGGDGAAAAGGSDAMDAPPPSPAAVRDGFEAPQWVLRTSASLLTVLMAAFAAVVVAAGPAGLGPRLAFALLITSLLTLALVARALLFRDALGCWLGRLRPTDVSGGGGTAIASRLGGAAALPVASVALVGLAVLVAHAAPASHEGGDVGTAAVAVGGACILACVVVWSAQALGARAAGAWVGDVAALRQRIERILAGDEGSMSPAALRTVSARGVASAVDGWAERHAQSVEDEAKARRSIEEMQRLKSRFMAYVSHDLRSPLNSIKGFAEILARGADGHLNPAQLESVEMIRQSGDDLLRLVNDILDSAKLEAGRLTLQRRWTPAVELLTEAVRQARDLAADRSIAMEVEVEPGLPPVHVDPDRVVQAVVGVLAHVVRVMGEGTVHLRARVAPATGERDRHLRLEVIDASAGLRAEDRERLFEAFRAVREASGRRVGGLGLGLALARGLVAAHGGDVWYERQGPRAGGPRAGSETAFCLSLPLTIGKRA